MAIIIIIVVAVIIAVVWLKFKMNKNFVIKQFKRWNVIVSGLKGRGKDVLFSMVTNTRYKKDKADYYCNVDYTGGEGYNEFKFDLMRLGDEKHSNTYKDFLDDTVSPYEYKGMEKVDFYISDASLYFPSQNQEELKKRYADVPLFYAIQRHIADSNTHCNIQNLGRLWDKIREQSDCYLDCRWCKVLFGKIAIQKVTYYDTYESAVMRLKPMKVPRNLIFKNKQAVAMKSSQDADRGTIKSMLIIHLLPRKSKRYDSRYLKEVLKKGSPNYNKKGA